MLAIIILLLIPTGYEDALDYQDTERVRAKVLSVDDSNIIDTGLVRYGEQSCDLKILNGRFYVLN